MILNNKHLIFTPQNYHTNNEKILNLNYPSVSLDRLISSQEFIFSMLKRGDKLHHSSTIAFANLAPQ